MIRWLPPPASGFLPPLRRRSFAVLAVAGALVVVLPALGPFTGSARLPLGARLVLVALVMLVEAAALRGRRPFERLGPIARLALAVVMVATSGKPHSIFWALHLLAFWHLAAACERGPVTAAWVVAASVLPGVVFAASGLPAAELAAAVFMAFAAPVIWVAAAGAATRLRAARREQARLAGEALDADARRERLGLLEQVRAALAACLDGALEEARLARGAAPDEARPHLQTAVAASRRALGDLRGAIWALDPTEGPWTTFEPRLRRLVAELSRDTCELECELPPERPVSPRQRYALFTGLRDRLAAGPAACLAVVARGEVLEWRSVR